MVHVFPRWNGRNAFEWKLHCSYFFEHLRLCKPRYDQLLAGVTFSCFRICDRRRQSLNDHFRSSCDTDATFKTSLGAYLSLRRNSDVPITVPSSFAQAYGASTTSRVCCNCIFFALSLKHVCKRKMTLPWKMSSSRLRAGDGVALQFEICSTDLSHARLEVGQRMQITSLFLFRFSLSLSLFR